MGNTVTAMKLANASTWSQLLIDTTQQQHIPFTVLIIGLLGICDKIDPVVVSSYIFAEDKKQI